jgi:hypothetical protein
MDDDTNWLSHWDENPDSVNEIIRRDDAYIKQKLAAREVEIMEANMAKTTTSIKIKLTPVGGYVVGDGKLPMDPDQFLIHFANRIIEAQRSGMASLEISGEEIDRLIEARKQETATIIMDTPFREISFPGRLTENKLLEGLNAVTE